jgi:hypothetical protein
MNMTPEAVYVSEKQKQFANDVQYLIEKNDDLTVQDMLIIASQIVGMLIARQKAGTSALVITAVVQNNIEIGNAVAVAALRDAPPAGRG